MPGIEQVVGQSPQDLLRSLPGVYARAAKKGLNVSTYLERQNPSDQYKDGSDAFGRICKEARVITESNPAAGQYATPVSDLLDGTHKTASGEEIGKEHGRALLMIWTERRWRAAKFQRSPNTRSLFTSEEDAIGTIARPWNDNQTLRAQDLRPKIPVNELVAIDTGINDTTYRTIYLIETEQAELEYVRVPEASEIPTTSIRTREETVRIHKYGRALDWTYEAARRMRLDRFELVLGRMALAVENGKVGTVLDVMINGDGNANTAATAVNVGTLDAAAVNAALTLRAYLGLKEVMPEPYQVTHIIARGPRITDLQMIPVGTANLPLIATAGGGGVGQLIPINGRDTTADGVRYASVSSGILATNYLAFDRRFAIERIYEIGATVSESDRFITSQVEVMTFTESEGFASLWNEAVMLLNMSA